MKLVKKAELSVDVTESNNQKLTDNQVVDKWELDAAKRTSLNLRTLLFEEAMLDLLKHQMDEADTKIKQYAAASNGDFDYGQLIMRVKGIKSETLFSSLRATFMAAKGTPEQVKNNVVNTLFPAHPEHYALGGGCIETMGGLPTLTTPMPVSPDQAPDFVKPFVDKSYSINSAGAGPLRDGTPFTYVLQQFRDTDDGMEANLMIWYPSGCPSAYVEEHIEHYAVEFLNGCRMASQNK